MVPHTSRILACCTFWMRLVIYYYYFSFIYLFFILFYLTLVLDHNLPTHGAVIHVFNLNTRHSIKMNARLFKGLNSNYLFIVEEHTSLPHLLLAMKEYEVLWWQGSMFHNMVRWCICASWECNVGHILILSCVNEKGEISQGVSLLWNPQTNTQSHTYWCTHPPYSSSRSPVQSSWKLGSPSLPLPTSHILVYPSCLSAIC